MAARHSCCAGHSPHCSPEGSQAVHSCPVDLFSQLLMMERVHLPENPAQPSACPSSFLLAAEGQACLKANAPARREDGSSPLTWAAHLCYSFFSSYPASSAWVPLLHPRSRRGMRCGSHGLCPCCSSLFSASGGIFGQLQSPGTQPQLPQLHTGKPGQSLGRKAQSCSSKCLNQVWAHLGVRHPNSLCPTMLPDLLLPSQAVPSPRSLTPGLRGLALPFSCRSSNLTHLFHSPMHPIGITRGEMGQDLGTVNAFPEKRVMLEGREGKIWCTRAFQSLFRIQTGPSLSLQGGAGCPDGSVQGEDKNRECHQGRGWIYCLLNPHTSHTFPSGSRST